MKTLNFELSKRLNDLGLLDNIKTEYEYFYSDDGFDIQKRINHLTTRGYKTLTLEEAIDFLPYKVNGLFLEIEKRKGMYYVEYTHKGLFLEESSAFSENLLEAIEKMIEYLLDNNLLLINNLG